VEFWLGGELSSSNVNLLAKQLHQNQGVACRFTTASRSSGWNANPQTDQMRRHERQALDAWTNGGMMQLAAGGTSEHRVCGSLTA
jgi:hypothetical protein